MSSSRQKIILELKIGNLLWEKLFPINFLLSHIGVVSSFSTAMSKETGMTAFDIVATLRMMGMLGSRDARCVLRVDRTSVDDYMSRTAKRRAQRIELDPDCLRWTPVVSTQMLLEEERQAEAEVSLVIRVRGLCFVQCRSSRLYNRPRLSDCPCCQSLVQDVV